MKRNSQEYLILSLSALAVAIILPFAFFRLVNADWGLGIVDIIIAIGMTSIFIYVHRSHKTEVPSIALAIFSISAALMSIHFKGVENLYWMYPAIVAGYYLVPCKWASLLAFLSIVLLLPILWAELHGVMFVSFIATLLMTSMFGFFFARGVKEKHDLLASLATRDSLTGTGNRRALDEKLAQIISSQARRPSTISLILLDIDHFKAVNDQFGHVVGDQVLVHLAKIIEGRIRITDALYRYGGEEFLIVPLELNLQSAQKLAEQLRLLVENNVLVPEKPVTISLGVAEYIAGESEESWFHRADEALYKAKKSGRNRVCVAG